MDHILRAYRTKNNLSRQELRVKLGCSYSLIQLIEDGRKRVTPEKAVQWETILGIPREKLCPEIFGKPQRKKAA